VTAFAVHRARSLDRLDDGLGRPARRIARDALYGPRPPLFTAAAVEPALVAVPVRFDARRELGVACLRSVSSTAFNNGTVGLHYRRHR
jgi:hypothetical protein